MLRVARELTTADLKLTRAISTGSDDDLDAALAAIRRAAKLLDEMTEA